MRKIFVSSTTLNAARLIATVSALAFAGSALAAGEATGDFYRSLIPGQQVQKLPEECYDEFGKLFITPQNVEICSALPAAAIGVPPGLQARGDENDGDTGVDTPGGPSDDPGGPPDDPGEPPDDPGGPADGKSNNGHGNNEDGVDMSNPGKSGKHANDSDPDDDDEMGHGKGPKNK